MFSSIVVEQLSHKCEHWIVVTLSINQSKYEDIATHILLNLVRESLKSVTRREGAGSSRNVNGQSSYRDLDVGCHSDYLEPYP